MFYVSCKYFYDAFTQSALHGAIHSRLDHLSHDLSNKNVFSVNKRPFYAV